MTNNFLVRQLVLNDLNDFFNLRLESLKNSPTSFLAAYEVEKESGQEFYSNVLKEKNTSNVIFGAFIDSNLVGIIGIYQAHNNRLKHKATIWGTYVNPEKRNLGIAKKLMQTAILHARNNMKCALINLCVESENISAKKLYESLGFKKWGTEPKGKLIDDKYFDEDHMILLF